MLVWGKRAPQIKGKKKEKQDPFGAQYYRLGHFTTTWPIYLPCGAVEWEINTASEYLEKEARIPPHGNMI